MAKYRSKYLPEKTLAVVKPDQKDTYSKNSITWLKQFENVRHALNGREVHILDSKVDGYNDETKTV